MAAFTEVVPWKTDSKLLFQQAKTAVELGYNNICINNFMEGALKGKKKGQKQEKDVERSPNDVKLSDKAMAELRKVSGRHIQQYTRFTTDVTDAGQTHKLQASKTIQAYDIIAVQPTSDKTFQLACQTLDVDIIQVDLSQSLPYFFKRTHVGVAMERGIHFEILYGPVIRSSSTRTWTIGQGMSLVKACRGKNIIISSGCERALEIRGPYDVANLGLLFGLTDAQAKDAVSTNWRSLLIHARTRKTTGSSMSIVKASNLNPKDAWKVKQAVADQPESSEDEEEEESREEEGEEPATKKQKLKT